MRGNNRMRAYTIPMLWAILLVFSLTEANAATGAKAGKTLLAVGKVTSKRATGEVPLKRRSTIYEQDEIRVGENSRAQIRMIDSALISLKENSVLLISQYQHQSTTPQNNSVALKLVSGGLRTITGAVGKNNKQAYKLKTPFATIGIRGTDYEIQLAGRDGMFVGVWDGVINLNSDQGGELQLGQNNDYSFAQVSPSGQITGLEKVPEAFIGGNSESRAKKPPPKDNAQAKKPEKPEKRGGKNDAVGAGDGDNAGDAGDAGTGQASQTEVVLPEFTTRDQSPDPLRAVLVTGASPTEQITGSASGLDSATPTFEVGGNEISSDGTNSTDFEQFVGGFPVSWGKFNEFTNAGATGTDLIWSAYDPTSSDIVSSRSGSVRYGSVVDSLTSGSQGSLNNLGVQMDVNFDTGQVTNGALSANSGADTWLGVFDGQVQGGDLSLQLNGASVINSDVDTPSDPRSASGFIDGDFVGADAEGIIGSFGLSENNSSNHIEGVFIVK